MPKLSTVPDTFNQAVYLVDRHLDEGEGNNTAIRFEDQQVTYAALAAAVNRAGNAFRSLGVEMENRVMILMPDRPEFFYSYLGAMKIGAVPVPVNTLALPKDYQYFLNNSRAKVLVVSADLLPKVEQVKNELSFLKHIVVVGTAPGGMLGYDALTTKMSDKLEPAPTSKDDMAFWMYTSGTTGQPKAVVHLHHDIIHYMYPFAEEVVHMTPQDSVMATSKMFFSYGRNASLELPLLFGGCSVLCSQWPDAAMVFQLAAKYRPSVFFSVPTFYASMLRELEKGTAADFSSVRVAFSSGEPMPRDIWERWKAKTGIEVLDIMGSTDAGAQYLANRPGQVKPGSSGKLIDAFDGHLRDGSGADVPEGQVGTLWLRNDGIAACYWNRHQRSREVFQGEWFNTGDLFYRDADGCLWFQGREDDMLKVSGQWVSPMEIEDVLIRHKAVREVGVIGVPDAQGLVRVKAFIMLNDGYQPSPQLEKELVDFVHDRIAHFKTPRWVQFVKELPRTTTGKLQRHKLRTGQV